MESKTIEDIYYIPENFASIITSKIMEHYGLTPTTTMVSNVKNYVCEPVWNKFKSSSILFNSDAKGIRDFKDNLMNTFYDVFTAFLTDTLHNLDFFNNLYGTKNTAFEKQIVSSIMPINQRINQSVTGVNIAQGTTGQQLSEIVPVNSAWNKAFELYFTPSRVKEHLDSFKWLFFPIINPKCDYVSKKHLTVNIDIAEELLQYCTILVRFNENEDYIEVTKGFTVFTNQVQFKFVPVDDGLNYLNVDINDDYIVDDVSPFDTEIECDMYKLTDDVSTCNIVGA